MPAVAAVVLLMPTGGLAATYDIDPGHSTVGFRIRHLVGRVSGSFTKFKGTLVFDEAQPARSRVNATIDAGSIDTRNEKRDEHLRSADFFDTAKYPSLTFASRKVTARGKGRFRVLGDLTLRGVKRPVVMDVDFTGRMQDPWGKTRTGFLATTRINRKDYGVSYNKTLDRGGLMLGEDVDITLEIEAVKR